MNKDIEEKLKNIKLKGLDENEKNEIWHKFSLAKLDNLPNNVSGFNYQLLIINLRKNMLATIISLLVILSGTGVVAASNSATPGDLLFGVDKAVEKIQLKLSNEEKQSELKIKFAEERLKETEEVIAKSGSQNTANLDLSTSNVTEIEVDVFTNETTVKIEANDKHYGFITAEKDKDKIIAEIKAKYNLSDSQMAIMSFELEDRESRADDKEFLNSFNSVNFKSEKQAKQIEASLDNVADTLADSNIANDKKIQIATTLAGIMALMEANPDLDIEVKTKDGYKVEVEDGQVEIKLNSGKSGKDDDDSDNIKIKIKDEDDDSDDEDESGSDSNDDDSDDSNDDNSGSGSNDEDDEDDDDSDDDNSDDDEDEDNDDEEDDDNSGSGSN